MVAPTACARFLISFPSPVAITLRIAASTAADGTVSSLRRQSCTGTPTLSSSVSRRAFLGWSECMGHAATGTPILRLSMQEFHPQWLRKSAVERWPRMSS
ncbi:unnamed protein product [Spirodela intermedia]|uniref:Uncharacterized protein n=2 Tax=Spirodela intermedia TaxID=51605 RepID=A0A7I8ICL0_SPIIN|nr:unnamed protein product [Spirodela intermedia]CAA6655389.1 unnamed protein product [Spirodela intermedia]CAA7390624.1 unnamed protein product [Spirodela intermedia]